MYPSPGRAIWLSETQLSLELHFWCQITLQESNFGSLFLSVLTSETDFWAHSYLYTLTCSFQKGGTWG